MTMPQAQEPIRPGKTVAPPMDAQLKSILTSIALAASTSVAAWAASRGLIPSADQSTLANDLVTIGFGVLSALIGWYKTRSQTPTAMALSLRATVPNTTIITSPEIAAATPN